LARYGQKVADPWLKGLLHSFSAHMLLWLPSRDYQVDESKTRCGGFTAEFQESFQYTAARRHIWHFIC